MAGPISQRVLAEDFALRNFQGPSPEKVSVSTRVSCP